MSGQAGSDRVVFNVVLRSPEVLFITDETVVIVLHPEWAFTPQDGIGFLGSKGFPGMKHVCQTVAGNHLGHDVDMVRHETPGDKPVAGSIKVEKCLFNETSDARIFEEAGTMAGVFILLDAFAQFHAGRIVRRHGSAGKIEFGFPAMDHRFRNAVIKSKSDGLDQAGLIEVREVTTGVPAFVRLAGNAGNAGILPACIP